MKLSRFERLVLRALLLLVRAMPMYGNDSRLNAVSDDIQDALDADDR